MHLIMEAKYNDLKTPKALAKKYPQYDFSSRDIGYLRMSGLIEGIKNNNVSAISEKSFLEFAERNRKDKAQPEALFFTEELLTDIVNALTYFINNAEKFKEVKKTGMVFFVVASIIDNENTDFEDDEEDTEDEEFEKNLTLLNKLFDFFNEMSIKQTQLLINSLKKRFGN